MGENPYEEGETSGQGLSVAPVHQKTLCLILNSGSYGFHFIKDGGLSPQPLNCK